MLIQYDFFESPEQSELRAEMKELREKQDRQRKAQFGEIGKLKKFYNEISERQTIIERYICYDQNRQKV